MAGLKFSGSPIENGIVKEMAENIHTNSTNPRISLIVKNGWKEILSLLGFIPVGEFDPLICKDAKWMMIAADKIKGRRK